MIAGKRVLGALAGDFSHSSHRQMFSAVSDTVLNLSSPPSTGGGFWNILRRGIYLLRNFRRKEFEEYQIILVESPFMEPSFYKRFFGAKFKIVSLFASPGIYKVFSGKANPVAMPILKSIVEQTDAFIPVSKMCADYLKENNIKRPMEVAYPYIEPAKYKIMQKNRYNINSRYLVAVGYPVEYKGIDFALKVFDVLAENDGGLELKLITRSLDPKYLSGIKHASRVKVMSNVGDEEFCKAVGGAAACLHFGRFDAFSVSSLEAMLAGVPTFTSTLTGAKEIAEKAGKNFVLEFDVEKSAENISRFLNFSEEEKIRLSKKFRRLAKPFNKKERIADFKVKFSRLVEGL